MTDPAIEEPREFVWNDCLDAGDEGEVTKLNASLLRLSSLRAEQINVCEHFARSKVAWKLASYQHSLLHRVVALVDGAAVAWNHGCTLSAMLSARAFMETFAVMYRLKERIREYLEAENLAGLNGLAQHGIFSTRDEEILREFPDVEATNAVTYVKWFDKRCPGFFSHYAILSERCHPNAMGHNFMFGELDRSGGTVRYAGERHADRNGHFIISGVMLLPMVERLMSDLDDLILKVADFQHRIKPVGERD